MPPARTVWDDYAAARLYAVIDGVRVPLDGPDAPRWRWGAVLYGLSAQNPFEVVLSDAENATRHAALCRRLDALGPFLVGVAGDLAGWHEATAYSDRLGWASALALARDFSQRALFAVRDDEVAIVDCADGTVRRARPRRT